MRKIFPLLAIVIAACGDAPSSVAATARPDEQSRASIGGASTAQAINDVVATLNAGWAAKSGAAYAAPFAEDAEVITPVGGILAGRAAVAARHVILFSGPLATSTQVLSIRSVRFLTGSIAIVDADAVLTTGPTVTYSLVRWVLTKRDGDWEIVSAQSTTVPPPA